MLAIDLLDARRRERRSPSPRRLSSMAGDASTLRQAWPFGQRFRTAGPKSFHYEAARKSCAGWRWRNIVAVREFAAATRDRRMARHTQSSIISRDAREGRLQARPNRIAKPKGTGPGVHALGLGQGRDGMLYVPKAVDPSKPAPLVVA